MWTEVTAIIILETGGKTEGILINNSGNLNRIVQERRKADAKNLVIEAQELASMLADLLV